ncbi:MAG: C39 family peptidase [Vulcanimicrobiaceae bacterium]
MDDLGPAFAQVLDARGGARLLVAPARHGVLSWNTLAEQGHIRFRLLRAQTPATPWFDYAQWHPTGRTSFSVESDKYGIAVEVDSIHTQAPFDGVDIRGTSLDDGSEIDFSLLALATPAAATPSLPYARNAMILDVPARSQYIVEGERGWCSPTSLSMVNAYHGIDVGVEATARAVLDRAYNGTGNWAFNVAYSGSLGLRAVVAFLPNLEFAQRLIERGLPVVLSYSWSKDELPGAPIEHSDGHLAVLCGFTANGDCAMNDPAAPGVRAVYPRASLERIWQRNNGLAYVIAPDGIDYLTPLQHP